MDFLTESLRAAWTEYDWIVFRVAAATLAGVVVGFEREMRDKPAGLRTMILISNGACVFAIVSEVMAQSAGENAPVDATRIAAQVVTGVGFLGAGSILRSSKAVYGLTTAAAIWMIAAIGMACGFGKFGIAGVGLIAVIMVLILFQWFERGIDTARVTHKYRIATRDSEVRFKSLVPHFQRAKLRILQRNCYRDGEYYVYTFRCRGPLDRHLSLREEFLHREDLTLRK